MSTPQRPLPRPNFEYTVLIDGLSYKASTDEKCVLRFNGNPEVIAKDRAGKIDWNAMTIENQTGRLSDADFRKLYRDSGTSLQLYSDRFPEDHVVTPFGESGSPIKKK